MSFSKDDKKKVFDFFESILLSIDGGPIYYDHLRGHVSKASAVVQRYVRRECKGERLLDFFRRRKNYFVVDKYDVSLRKKKLITFSSRQFSKSTKFAKISKDEVLKGSKYSTAATEIDSYISSRKSTLDSNQKMDDYEELTLKYFCDYLSRNQKLHLNDIELDTLPKKVQRYLASSIKKKVSLFFQKYPSKFHIDHDCVTLVIPMSYMSLEVEESCSQVVQKPKETSDNVDLDVCQSSFEEQSLENFIRCVDFFAGILKKKTVPVVPEKLSGHLSHAPAEILAYLESNYKPFTLFFLDAPCMFIFNDQNEISLCYNYSKLLKRARKMSRFKAANVFPSTSIQDVFNSLFELPLNYKTSSSSEVCEVDLSVSEVEISEIKKIEENVEEKENLSLFEIKCQGKEIENFEVVSSSQLYSDEEIQIFPPESATQCKVQDYSYRFTEINDCMHKEITSCLDIDQSLKKTTVESVLHAVSSDCNNYSDNQGDPIPEDTLKTSVESVLHAVSSDCNNYSDDPRDPIEEDILKISVESVLHVSSDCNDHSDYPRDPITEDILKTSVESVLHAVSSDCNDDSDIQGDPIAEDILKTYEYFLEYVYTVYFLCFEMVDKEQNLKINHECETVKFFVDILKNLPGRICELQNLQGSLGQASNEVVSFIRQMYKGEKLKDFFQKQAEFLVNPRFSLVQLSSDYDNILEARLKLQNSFVKTEDYYKNLADNYYIMKRDVFKGLLKIISFLKNKEKSKISRLCGFVCKFDSSFRDLINRFCGKGQPEKLKKILGHFRIFVFLEDFVAINPEINFSFLVSILEEASETLSDETLKVLRSTNYEYKIYFKNDYSLDHFETTMIQVLNDFLVENYFINFSDLPKVLGPMMLYVFSESDFVTEDLFCKLFSCNLFKVDNGEICLSKYEKIETFDGIVYRNDALMELSSMETFSFVNNEIKDDILEKLEIEKASSTEKINEVSEVKFDDMNIVNSISSDNFAVINESENFETADVKVIHKSINFEGVKNQIVVPKIECENIDEKEKNDKFLVLHDNVVNGFKSIDLPYKLLNNADTCIHQEEEILENGKQHEDLYCESSAVQLSLTNSSEEYYELNSTSEENNGDTCIHQVEVLEKEKLYRELYCESNAVQLSLTNSSEEYYELNSTSEENNGDARIHQVEVLEIEKLYCESNAVQLSLTNSSEEYYELNSTSEENNGDARIHQVEVLENEKLDEKLYCESIAVQLSLTNSSEEYNELNRTSEENNFDACIHQIEVLENKKLYEELYCESNAVHLSLTNSSEEYGELNRTSDESNGDASIHQVEVLENEKLYKELYCENNAVQLSLTNSSEEYSELNRTSDESNVDTCIHQVKEALENEKLYEELYCENNAAQLSLTNSSEKYNELNSTSDEFKVNALKSYSLSSISPLDRSNCEKPACENLDSDNITYDIQLFSHISNYSEDGNYSKIFNCNVKNTLKCDDVLDAFLFQNEDDNSSECDDEYFEADPGFKNELVTNNDLAATKHIDSLNQCSVHCKSSSVESYDVFKVVSDLDSGSLCCDNRQNIPDEKQYSSTSSTDIVYTDLCKEIVSSVKNENESVKNTASQEKFVLKDSEIEINSKSVHACKSPKVYVVDTKGIVGTDLPTEHISKSPKVYIADTAGVVYIDLPTEDISKSQKVYVADTTGIVYIDLPTKHVYESPKVYVVDTKGIIHTDLPVKHDNSGQHKSKVIKTDIDHYIDVHSELLTDSKQPLCNSYIIKDTLKLDNFNPENNFEIKKDEFVGNESENESDLILEEPSELSPTINPKHSEVRKSLELTKSVSNENSANKIDIVYEAVSCKPDSVTISKEVKKYQLLNSEIEEPIISLSASSSESSDDMHKNHYLNNIPENLAAYSENFILPQNKGSTYAASQNLTPPFLQPLSATVVLLAMDSCIVETKFEGKNKLVLCLKLSFHCDLHNDCSKCYDSLKVGDVVSCCLHPSDGECNFGTMCISSMFWKDGSNIKCSDSHTSQIKKLSKRYESKSPNQVKQDFPNTCGSHIMKKNPHCDVDQYCSQTEIHQGVKSKLEPRSSMVDAESQTVLLITSQNDQVDSKCSEKDCQTELSGQVKLYYPVAEKESQVNCETVSQVTQVVFESYSRDCQTEVTGDIKMCHTGVEIGCQATYQNFSQKTQTLYESIERTSQTESVQFSSHSTAEKECQVACSTISQNTQTFCHLSENECQTDISGNIKLCVDSNSLCCQTILSGQVKKCPNLANNSCQSKLISSRNQASQTSSEEISVSASNHTSKALNVSFPLDGVSSLDQAGLVTSKEALCSSESNQLSPEFDSSRCETESPKPSDVDTRTLEKESCSVTPDNSKILCEGTSQTIATGSVWIQKFYLET